MKKIVTGEIVAYCVQLDSLVLVQKEKNGGVSIESGKDSSVIERLYELIETNTLLYPVELICQL